MADDHETLVYRLAQILIKLNQGERLDPNALADEFGVNIRTIQRDLNVRFAYLPLEKIEGRYALDARFLGKLSTRDIDRFASLAGVRGLFPSLTDDFLHEIFSSSMGRAILVKGHSYEDVSQAKEPFRVLETAIVNRANVAFDYDRIGHVRRYESVSPYRLINDKGIWYLAGLHDGKLKAFAFTKISAVCALEERFAWDQDLDARLVNEDGIWLSDELLTVVMEVDRSVAPYFKRRKVVPNQEILEEKANGDLVVSCRVGHTTQVLSLARYWLPNVRIQSPPGLQAQLEEGLRSYLTAQKSKQV